MKDAVSTVVGLAAGMLSGIVGGFDTPVLVLVVSMGVDYVTGLIVAGVFHASPKTSGGGLDSRVGWKGLARKFVTLLIVVIANLADILLEVHYIRDAAIFGFCANECISILENAGLMAIRNPRVLTAALEKLSEEAEDESAS